MRHQQNVECVKRWNSLGSEPVRRTLVGPDCIHERVRAFAHGLTPVR